MSTWHRLTRQGLSRSRPADPVSATRQGGWLYQTGGGCAYLSLRARVPGLRRADVDAAVADGRLAITGSVRGCTMLVPAEDLPLARSAGNAMLQAMISALQQRGGLDAEALRKLADRITEALDEPGLSPEALRARVPAAQPLGESGRKLGYATTLPLALRCLELEGRARRVPASGRLDDERYLWRPDRPSTTPEPDLALARAFQRWFGPATRPDLAAWAGWPQQKAARVLARAGEADPVDAEPTEEPIFLPFRDNALSLGISLESWVRPEHVDVPVLGWSGEPAPLGAQSSLHHHAVLWRGALAGIWEFDGQDVVCGWFGEVPPGADEEALRLGAWIREELGLLRIYAQDGARQRAARLAAVRALAR